MNADSGPPIDFATLDLLPYGIIVTDRHGTVLFYNQREEEIAGRSRADVIGRNFFKDIAPCTQVAAFKSRFDQAVALNTVATFEFVFPFPGNPRAVEIAISGFDHRGSRLCTISVNDKTEQERVRAEVLQAERFRELGEVAGTVAHNFNNLLMIIRGNAELLRDDLDPGVLREQCQDIIQAADDGSALVGRLRQTMTRDRRAAVPAILVNPIVTDAAEAMRRTVRSGANIALELSPQVDSACVAASELREVLFNLIRNALDATEARDHPEIRISTTLVGRRILIAIKDNGIGMSDEVRRRLFQPLFTTKGDRGTGLGLASSLALMRGYGGTLEVTSTDGVGSEISIFLPHASAN